MSEDNKMVVRRYIDMVQQDDMDLWNELVDVNHVIHYPDGVDVRGYQAYLEWSAPFQTAFPDISRVVEDLFGEGDKVAVRFTFSGTHTGEFSGVAPTGYGMTFGGIAIYRISEGKIAEQWVEFDFGSLMKQIDVTTD